MVVAEMEVALMESDSSLRKRLEYIGASHKELMTFDLDRVAEMYRLSRRKVPRAHAVTPLFGTPLTPPSRHEQW